MVGGPSVFVISRERAKLGYFWRHSVCVPRSGPYLGNIVNPDTGKVQPKASYVVALNDRLLLGCGIYRSTSAASAVQASTGADRPAAAAPARGSVPQALPA